MKSQIVRLCLTTYGLTLTLAVIPSGFASAQVIVSNEAANGSVELSNISFTDSPDPTAVEANANAGAFAVGQNPDSTHADVPKDPREQYRDKVMKDAEATTSATSAVSRRYKRVDLAIYRAAMQVAPTAQVGSSVTK